MKIVTLNSLNQFRKNIECINGEIPIGSIIAYSSDNIPNNYLLCDGSANKEVTWMTIVIIG